MLKANYEFEVLVNGHSAKEYYHNGSYYIEGKEGSRFSLRMCNNTASRALFIPTVDGLSIMNGKEASFASRGYIVNAYDSTTVDGWRTSDDKVAEFFFSSPKASYAKKLDKGGNLGVIGCAVFQEKFKEKEIVYIPIVQKEYVPVYPPLSGPYWGTSYPHWTYTTTSGGNSITNITSNHTGDACSYSMQCGATGSSNSVQTSTSSISSSLGTGFGQEKTSSVVSVGFDKESTPIATFSLFYNTKQALEDLGVQFIKPVYITPSAFPEESGYCQRPE